MQGKMCIFTSKKELYAENVEKVFECLLEFTACVIDAGGPVCGISSTYVHSSSLQGQVTRGNE